MMPVDNRLLVIAEIGCGPPYMGNRARMRSLLAECRQLGFDIHFAGVQFSEEEKQSTRPHVDRWVGDFLVRPPRLAVRLLNKVRRRLNCLLGSRPFKSLATSGGNVDGVFHPHWRKEVRQLQRRERYQRVLVAYVFHSAFLEAFPKDCLKILDTHDVFADRAARLAQMGLRNFWFTTTTAEERRGLLRADVVLAIQDQEAECFRKLLNSEREIRTVRHFIELHPLPVVAVDGDRIEIGFIASDNPLNVDAIRWFLEAVWPAVASAFPQARLLLGGRICRVMAGTGSVELVGEVENLAEFYSRCLFTINPMRVGTGLKIKTLESLAYGRPVVASPVGAEGLESFVDRGIAVAEDAQSFVRMLGAWLEDPRLTISLGAAAVQAARRFNESSRGELKSALRV